MVCKQLSENLLCFVCEQRLILCIDTRPNMNAFFYQEPVSSLITNFKYHQDLHAAKVLSKYAAQVLSGMWQQYDAIIPMPVHRLRLVQRGMHCTDFLAKTIMKYSNNPLPIIKTYGLRQIYSAPQQLLGARARATNINSSHFSLPELSMQRYLVFDDVITSGATWRAFQKHAPDKLFLCSLASAS